MLWLHLDLNHISDTELVIFKLPYRCHCLKSKLMRLCCWTGRFYWPVWLDSWADYIYPESSYSSYPLCVNGWTL